MKARVIDQWPRFAIVIDLEVSAAEQEYRKVELILDTGFTGHIALPKSFYHESMYTLKERFTLADDRAAEFQVGFFTVRSDASIREEVPTVFMGSNLIGLSFLRGMHAAGRISHDETIDLIL
jgi:predicted aspartyl protease